MCSGAIVQKTYCGPVAVTHPKHTRSALHWIDGTAHVLCILLVRKKSQFNMSGMKG